MCGWVGLADWSPIRDKNKRRARDRFQMQVASSEAQTLPHQLVGDFVIRRTVFSPHFLGRIPHGRMTRVWGKGATRIQVEKQACVHVECWTKFVP